MLIESFAPSPDAIETRWIEIAASPEAVYKALWTTDLANSVAIKLLLGLRSLPEFVLRGGRAPKLSQRGTLQSLVDAGVGKLAEEVNCVIVLGISGKIW